MKARRTRGLSIVWVPVGTNVLLVALAALFDDATAIALTSVGAVVVTGAVIVHLRESEADKERIAHLQAALPTLTSPIDPDVARNITPQPSPVMTEVLKQAAPAALSGTSTLSIPRPEGIDRG